MGLGDTRVSPGEAELVMHKPWLGAADPDAASGHIKGRGSLAGCRTKLPFVHP